MSAIYDNWERLVDAVVKKQQLWELCHDHSRSPSILSRASSDLSSSSFISRYRLDDQLASDFASHWSSPSTYRINPKLVDVSKISSIKDLQVAAAKMEDKRVDLQNKVEAAKRNGELILREVETWLADAQETQRTAKQIIEAEIPAGMLSLKPRYSLSRKAIKKTESIKKLLRESSNFNPLSTPRTFDPPAPSKGTMIDSRKETEEDIIMAIKDAGVSAIGIWGMGGVGKTTMAKQIMARAGEEGLLDEFPFVTVSQQPDIASDVAKECKGLPSLEHHLFRRGPQPLAWATRIKVAVGAATGLSFLHDAKEQVIYTDFKASNILLDGEFNAKLSDFGLAKAGPTGDRTHVSTRVMGTYGYAAPEYVATGQLTTKSDVYSFGVVLLELLSGRRAVDKTKVGVEQNLVGWARPYMGDKRKLFRIMDIKLEGQYPHKAAFAAATVALQCLRLEPKLRPRMTEVLATLEELQAPKSARKYHSPVNVAGPLESPARRRSSRLR